MAVQSRQQYYQRFSGISGRGLGRGATLPGSVDTAAFRGGLQSSLQGGVFSDLDSILGSYSAITGSRTNLSVGGGLLSRAGQQDVLLSDEQRNAFSQFFSPTITAEQQGTIESLAKRAAGQGLQGGAVRGQLGDIATGYLAGNRAAAYQTVQDVTTSRVNAIQQDLFPFLQQVGLLRHGNAGDVVRASGATSGDYQDFARTGLQALSSLGFGADALAGVARRQGVAYGPEGLTGAADIGEAFAQFLAPGAEQAQPVLAGLRRAGRAGFAGGAQQYARAFQGVQTRARASNRVGAGEQLAARLQESFSDLTSQAAELSSLGAAAQVYNRVGGIGAARQLAGLDFSRYEGLSRALGIGQGSRTSRGASGNFRGIFTAGNPLFRQVFGAA